GLPWLPVMTEGSDAAPYRAYLDANETVLDFDAPTLGLALAPEDVDARYVILGEMHGYAAPQAVDAALVRLFQTQGSPRWYLAEMTPREAMAANTYIAGGGEERVRAVFDRFAAQNAQWANNEFFGKLTTLRELNASLSPERQVRFIGVDAPRAGEAALALASSRSKADLGDPASAQSINRLLDVAAENRGGSRYDTILSHMETLAGLPGFDAARFVGLWGIFHAHEASVNGGTPLAALLQEPDAPYAGDVVTIHTICFGPCYNMMPAAALPGPVQGQNGEGYTWVPMDISNPYFQRPKGVSDVVDALGEQKAALYRIDGPNSPYKDGDRLTAYSGYLVQAQPWNVDGAAADAMDYLIAFKGSAPLTPWSGAAFDISGGVGADHPELVGGAGD
ncbi:MAG: hypothetical protein AAGC56_10140, partial [Pseudomonadota bacterium]